MVDKQPDGEDKVIICQRGHKYNLNDGTCLACELRKDLAAQDPCKCYHVFDADDFEEEIDSTGDPRIFKAFCPACKEVISREI